MNIQRYDGFVLAMAGLLLTNTRTISDPATQLVSWNGGTLRGGIGVGAYDGDFKIEVNQTVASAIGLDLPPAAGMSSQPGNKAFLIYDGKGDAGTNNITLRSAGATFDGAATYVLNQNYAGVWVEWTGTKWHVLAEVKASAGAVSAAAVIAALAAATGAISVNNQKLTSVGTPTNPADAATKGYVDGQWQDGASTLVAGTKTINTGITITANSRIIITPSLTGQPGVKYVVTARTVGAPGTGAFTVQAQDNTGTLVNTDVSTFDYLIKG